MLSGKTFSVWNDKAYPVEVNSLHGRFVLPPYTIASTVHNNNGFSHIAIRPEYDKLFEVPYSNIYPKDMLPRIDTTT